MFTKLSPTDLARYRLIGRIPEYTAFVESLGVGEGGRVDVKAAGVGRQSVKNRVRAAATATGLRIKYVRSGADTVVFEVVGAGDVPRRRRGRPAKQAGG